MYNCPRCGADSFSFWQKHILGPARSIQCRSCKGRVGVPWARALLATSPIWVLGSIGIAYFGAPSGGLFGLFISGIVGALIGYAIATPLYHRYVPLVPRKP